MLTQDFFDDPYPFYAQLRAQEHAVWSDEFAGDGAWLISRHADASSALKDARLSVRRAERTVAQLATEQQSQFSAFNDVFSRWMLFQNPPQHTDLRKLMSPAFRPGSLAEFRPRIEAIVGSLLDQLHGRDRIDFIRDVAHPLPALVIADMLGIDPDHHDSFIRWSNDIAAFFGNVRSVLQVAQAAQRGMLAMREYFRVLLPRRRSNPGSDLISLLILGEGGGEPLTEDDLIAQCTLLLFAGHETTRNLLGNGVLALLRNPQQWHDLRDSRDLLPGAVRELLRYDSPVQCTARKALQDMDLCGSNVHAGQAVVILLGSANRDPDVFAQPAELDIRRQQGSHLSFGTGAHVCIGAALTHMEAEITFNFLLDRIPDARLVDEALAWQRNFAFRGLKFLPLSI